MRDLRIVFMGTPEFAVAVLEKILNEKLTVVGVITAPDKPAGRGRQLKQSAVKEFAVANELPVLQPTNLKDEQFLKDLENLKANLQVVVAFRMLPEVVWKMPAFGTFNLHASLLPDYRGAAPINWALINGETKSGVTTFFIDEKIDTGEIILQREVLLTEIMNAGELHDLLMHEGAELVIETIKAIEKDQVITRKQPEVESPKKAPKLFKDNCKIVWEQSAARIHNLIRGLSPYPGAWCYLMNDTDESAKEPIKIFKTLPERGRTPVEKPGSLLVEKNSLRVAATDGYLNIIEMQLPGKRKMHVKDILNGYSFKDNARLL
ncbi:methionyl-tRNA formyltransferase [Flavobacteriaceae bacterium M23B6Z8]